MDYFYEKNKQSYYEGKKHKKPILYPEVYIPYDAFLISRKRPEIPVELYEPNKPKEPASIEQSPPKIPVYGFISPAFFIIGIILLVIYFLCRNIDFCVLSSISFSIAMVVFLAAFGPFKDEKREYAGILERYENELELYEREMEEYNTKIADYEKNKDKYKLKIAEIQSEENIIKYRKELFENEFRSNLSGFSRTNATSIKRGASELFFSRYLKSQFDECDLEYKWNILTDAKVSKGIGCNDYYTEESAYYPDLVFVYGNLFIDIEIDEPYVGDSKKPIHYQFSVSTKEKRRGFGGSIIEYRKTTYNSIDKARDFFFLSNNWCVIRFAEEQIYTDPYNCFLLVKKVAKSIISFNGFPMFDNSIDLCVEPMIKWTEHEAKQMAALDYRDSYIIQ